uniref:PD-(D/E)XK nuclease superfamily protein n=1 Tax=Candidatus Kentrum sp. UNK TaxID=2126344 RepID=A0A451AVB6_9GAMM|nr:MAG: PD-(D/E)XK nuclease superfamily protein [Candidatus Kentron sp. UNK]
MIAENLRDILETELPGAIRNNPELQDWVLRIGARAFADRADTDSRFDRILNELKRDRELQSRKWEEQKAEWDKKWEAQRTDSEKRWQEQKAEWEERWKEQNAAWDKKWEAQRADSEKRWQEQKAEWEETWKAWKLESDRRWDENNRRWEENDRRWEKNDLRWDENDRRWEKNDQRLGRIERSLGAMGVRWGGKSESSFRNALAGILEESFDVKVLNVTEFDEEGKVFGHPDQIELDIIIKNGLLLICELKSSVSRSDVYTFERKTRFYEKRHRRRANRLILISPMISPRAKKVAKNFGINIYTDSTKVETL